MDAGVRRGQDAEAPCNLHGYDSAEPQTVRMVWAKMSTTETLKTTLLSPEFEPYKERIMRKLLGIQMLASVQDNLCRDIESILNEHGQYRYSMKMNINQLHRCVRANINNDSFFGRMTQEQIDKHIESYEPLEKLVYDFIESDD